MLDQISYSLPDGIGVKVREKIAEWRAENKIARIWAKDATVWTNDDEAKWLGWLDIVDEELGDLQKYRDFSAEASEFNDFLLLGMGGSSLCPEVQALTFNKGNFQVLDSTVPSQVNTVYESIVDASKALFIVASKSGSTLEPNCFKQFFYQMAAVDAGPEHAGKHFVAITDPGSKMQQVAEHDSFRHIFFGKPEIGGRFSALSVFGMAAAAAMELDVETLLRNAKEMVDACKDEDPEDNPGAMLGLILGICQQAGRDKLTIFASPEIHDLGAWLEQLIAESTGKDGVAIIPIDGEALQSPAHYGDDRVFVHIKFKDSKFDDSLFADVDEVTKGHPLIKIELEKRMNLGQEFFRWEFATAVAGSVMGINPFNQPDVESAKIEARKLTDEYEKTGSFPEEKPFFESDGFKLFSSEKYAAELNDAVGDQKTLKRYFEEHVFAAGEGDYFATLAYVEMNEENSVALRHLRERILELNLAPSCLGFGPRFLHSTGQAYKGGGNNGVFLQLTADDAIDLEVPGQSYTFGVVKTAQARGDFQVLLDRGRRALRIHLGLDVKAGVEKLIGLLKTEA